MRAGHSQGSVTERYVHAAQVLFPGAAERGEARTFAGLSGTKSGTKWPPAPPPLDDESSVLAGLSSYSPGWTRTNNPPVNSRMLCQLSYRGTAVAV